jgi:hypothetical protein
MKGCVQSEEDKQVMHVQQVNFHLVMKEMKEDYRDIIHINMNLLLHEIVNAKLFRFQLILTINFFHLNDLIDLEDDVLILLLNYHQMNSIIDGELEVYKLYLK